MIVEVNFLKVLPLQLKDIRTPESVPWWPPAPGWWLLAGLSLLLVTALILHRWRRSALRRSALAELDAIRNRFQHHGEGGHLAMELSVLLKRVALARLPQQRPAGLTGEDWLRFLDLNGGGGAFTRGPGRAFSSAPYKRRPTVDQASLLRLAERWIRINT